ncbi:DUF935 domain-containing protein [Thalassospira xiamenensis]|uniref:Mu-like prophage protein gp29 n=1 Tax=Thalassospira xiamenensis TaxID=220697 RepID=A0A367XHP9_9PROT|nr:DUF935 family protein [Thalassospira xiamenensis]KZB51114.1 hypothetical protein AUP41_08395 [Thalassospira xiamenensis]RCK53194.1 hypothetical protein TH44_03085 [Thalassospira xiamenensis]
MAKKNKKAAAVQKPVVTEVAGVKSDLALAALVNEITTPNDTVLKSIGGRYDEYTALLRDDQVKAAFGQRLDAMVAKEIIVEPGGTSPADKKAAEFIKAQLEAINFDAACRKMAHAQFYGYSVAEILWAFDGMQVGIDAIKVRKFDRFRFDGAGRLRLITKTSPKGEFMPDRKFWVSTVETDNDDDPYGLGLAHFLYWPVYLKRNGLRFWAVALEKFGMPTAIGKHHPGASENDVANLLSLLSAIHGQAAVTVPEGQEIKLLEAMRSSGGDHKEFVAYLDAMIAKVIVGQTSTTDSGSWRGTANVHKDVRDEIIKADTDLLCGSFNNGPIRWLTEWNFPGAKPPRVWRVLDDNEDLDNRVKRDKTIYEMGFDPDVEYINSTYGGTWTKRTTPTTVNAPESPQFAERNPDTIDRAIEDELADWQPMMDPVLQPIFDLVEEAASFEEISARLPEIYGDMDVATATDKLQKLTFAVEVATRAGAELDGDD